MQRSRKKLTELYIAIYIFEDTYLSHRLMSFFYIYRKQLCADIQLASFILEHFKDVKYASAILK